MLPSQPANDWSEMEGEAFPHDGAIFATEVADPLTSLDDASIWRSLGPGQQWARFILGGRDDTHAPQVWIIELPPHYVIPQHYHDVHRIEIMLKGSYRLDGQERGPGAITFFKAGELYGPIEYGPEGGTSLEVFSDSANLRPIFAEEPGPEIVANLSAIGMKPVVLH
jgi:hypothetical protein